MSARTIRYEFFDSIGHERQIENVRAMYACTPTPEVSLQCGKRSSWANAQNRCAIVCWGVRLICEQGNQGGDHR